MTGLSSISGVFSCTNPWNVMPSDKAHVRTYNAKIFAKQDNCGQVICCKALVYFFVLFNTHHAFDEGIYIVSGKMSMVNKDTPIGNEFNRDDYLFQIDTIIVCLFLSVLLFIAALLKEF
jgi:hypothetical protein